MYQIVSLICNQHDKLMVKMTILFLLHVHKRMYVEFICWYSPTGLTTPTLKALTNELKSVSDWFTLGVNLNVKHYHLKTIERSHYVDNNRCKTEMLSRWLDSTSNPNWETVAKALDQMDEHNLADKIRRNYITSTTISSTEGTVLLYMHASC